MNADLIEEGQKDRRFKSVLVMLPREGGGYSLPAFPPISLHLIAN